jgi:fucose permease
MLILAAVLAIFVYGMIAAMLGTILPGLSERFHLTPNQNGRIAFAQAMGLTIASVGVGPLIDNEGKKIGLVLGLALVAVALASLPKSRGFGSIAALLFVLGLGGGVVVTGANALVSDVAPDHRGTALNLVNLFFGLGGMATPFISANLLKRDIVKLCYAAGAFALIALAVGFAAPIPGPTGVRSFVLADAGTVLGKPILLMLGLMLFLYVSCEVGIWNWLAQHLIAQGIPESRALNILSLGFALGLLVGRVAVSPILITVPPEQVTLASAIAMAVTSYLALRVHDAKAAWILVFFAGVAMAPVFPTTLAIVGNAFPRMTGTAIGFAITCGWLGLAVSSRIVGAIAGGDPKRLKTALLVIPAFSVVMVVLNLAILSMLHK